MHVTSVLLILHLLMPLQTLESLVDTNTEFNKHGKPKRNWQTAENPTTNHRYVATAKLFMRKTPFNVAANIPYKVHPWLQAVGDDPASRWMPNKDRLNLFHFQSTDRVRQAKIWVCKLCLGELKDGLMPRLSLANWLYYGRESLPLDVKEAFHNISVFEKAMIARARTNSICCRFNNPSSQTKFGDEGNRSSAFVNTKRGMKGNVIVAPLDVMRLNEYLPPSVDVIRDTLCVLFVGKGGQPTRANIEKSIDEALSKLSIILNPLYVYLSFQAVILATLPLRHDT
jgi:hypothetical protein